MSCIERGRFVFTIVGLGANSGNGLGSSSGLGANSGNGLGSSSGLDSGGGGTTSTIVVRGRSGYSIRPRSIPNKGST